MEDKKKWYDNKAVVIILLVVFFPVGLYALWKSKSFSIMTKGIITGVVFLLLIVAGAQDDGKEGVSEKSADKKVSAANEKIDIGVSLESIDALAKSNGFNIYLPKKCLTDEDDMCHWYFREYKMKGGKKSGRGPSILAEENQGNIFSVSIGLGERYIADSEYAKIFNDPDTVSAKEEEFNKMMFYHIFSKQEPWVTPFIQLVVPKSVQIVNEKLAGIVRYGGPNWETKFVVEGKELTIHYVGMGKTAFANLRVIKVK